jgi:hypothetical protein
LSRSNGETTPKPLESFKYIGPFLCCLVSQYYIGSHSGIFVVLSGFLNVCNLMKSVLKKPPSQGQMAFCHHQSNLIDKQVLTQSSLDWCTCCENITEPCNCKIHQMVSIPAFLQHLPQHLSAPKIKGDIWHVSVWKGKVSISVTNSATTQKGDQETTQDRHASYIRTTPYWGIWFWVSKRVCTFVTQIHFLPITRPRKNLESPTSETLHA